FRKVISLEPHSAETHLNLGIALADGFDLKGALDAFSEAVRIDPSSALAHYNKGRALRDLHRYQEARSALEEACRLDPNLSSALHLLALVERQLDNNAGAAELLQRVVR